MLDMKQNEDDPAIKARYERGIKRLKQEIGTLQRVLHYARLNNLAGMTGPEATPEGELHAAEFPINPNSDDAPGLAKRDDQLGSIFKNAVLNSE